MNNTEIIAITVCLGMLTLHAMEGKNPKGSGRARRAISSVGGAFQEGARTAAGTVRGAASDLLSSLSSPSRSSDSNASSSGSSGSGSSSLLASRSSSHSSGSSGSLAGQADSVAGSSLLRRSSSGIHLPSLEAEHGALAANSSVDSFVIHIPCPPDTERLRLAQEMVEQCKHDIKVMKGFCVFILMAHLVHLWRIYS